VRALSGLCARELIESWTCGEAVPRVGTLGDGAAQIEPTKDLMDFDVLKIDAEDYERKVRRGARIASENRAHINRELHLDDEAALAWSANKVLDLIPLEDSSCDASWIAP
jgi:hypothetical protein